jgi:nitric oxide reductase NorE protein
LSTEGEAKIPASDLDAKHPGTSGIWTFVFVDMIVFAVLFLVFVSERHRLPEVFTTSQAALDPRVGLFGTLLLITSSCFVADAVHSVREWNMKRARISLALAILFGLGFAANKLAEYVDKFSHDLSPVTNGFFTFYFLVTGLHFLHVIGGLCFLGHCRMRISNEVKEFSYRKNTLAGGRVIDYVNADICDCQRRAWIDAACGFRPVHYRCY